MTLGSGGGPGPAAPGADYTGRQPGSLAKCVNPQIVTLVQAVVGCGLGQVVGFLCASCDITRHCHRQAAAKRAVRP